MSGFFLAHKSETMEAPPPLVKLALEIIRQAQRDVVAGRTYQNKHNYDDAVQFFGSHYYQILLDYIECWFPDIPRGLPQGVRL